MGFEREGMGWGQFTSEGVRKGFSEVLTLKP